MDEVTKRALQAEAASEEQVLRLLHDPSMQVIRMLLLNRHLQEKNVVALLNRNDLSEDIIERIAKSARWSDSYPVRLAIARHARTPIAISLGIVRQLRIFDCADIAQSHRLPLAFRRKVETILIERLPTLPLGYKKTLAKRASGNILLALLRESDAELIGQCLDNPSLHEQILFKAISGRNASAAAIRIIAQHRRWSRSQSVRAALVRSDATPLAVVGEIVHHLSLFELRELERDRMTPSGVRPLLHREFLARGEEPGAIHEDAVYEIPEDADERLDELIADHLD